MANEIELKLAIQPQDITKLLAHPLLQACAVQEKFLVNHYFDTPDLALQQRKIALRIREIGEKKIQTLKTAGQAQGGIHQRQEWECETEHNQPKLDHIEDGYLQHWFQSEQIESKLGIIFSTNFSRKAYQIAFQGSDIELAIDQGEVRYQTQSDPISEVELELKQGNIEDLFELALQLTEHLSLRLYNVSKAQRGYQLFLMQSESEPEDTQAQQELQPIPAVAHLSVNDAFKLALSHYMDQWQQAEHAFLQQGSIINAHRLALSVYTIKRLFNFFSKLIPKKSSSEIRAELNWFAETLEWLLPSHEMYHMGLGFHGFCQLYHRMPLQESLQQLLLEEIQSEEELIIQIRHSIYSARYAQLLLRLSQWLFKHDWEAYLKPESEKAMTKSIKSFCDNQLQKYWHELASIFSPQHELDSHAYCDQVDRLLNIMMMTNSWSVLYDQQRIETFIESWFDLQTGMIDLDIMYQIRSLSSQLLDDQSSVLYEWLDSQEEGLMQAMLQTRRAMAQQEAYWP